MKFQANVLEFTGGLQRYAQQAHASYDVAVRTILLELFRRIIMRTPVDSGRLAGNWQFAVGTPTAVVLGAKKKGAGSAGIRTASVARVEQMVRGVKFDPPGAVYWIFNNLPYAQVVEFGLYPNPPKKGSRVSGGRGRAAFVIKSVGGYSKQAPSGMVRVAIAEVSTHLVMAMGGYTATG